MDDRRRSPRTNLYVSAFVKVQGIELHARTHDVSSGGLSLLMFRSLPVGTACEVELRLHVGGRYEHLQAKATVLHSAVAEEGGFRVGMRFDDIDERREALFAALQ